MRRLEALKGFYAVLAAHGRVWEALGNLRGYAGTLETYGRLKHACRDPRRAILGLRHPGLDSNQRCFPLGKPSYR